MSVETALKEGQKIEGFEIITILPLEELNALGIYARHSSSGAELFHIRNEDKENLFAFAFSTPSMNSTGVAHVLEHSVLCGSQRYPLKDAFIVLAQGSLQTFLNAMTYPDKTVYPASSTNRKDYFNLMSVYGDAVFHPLLEEWTFMQEGHRLRFEEPGSPSDQNNPRASKLARLGVVYNEMKGNYSSMDSIAADWTFRSVFPDTPYAYDSGGDPDEIPHLTWEALRSFHQKQYVGANCKIFLCGDIPTEEQLQFLNSHFLKDLDRGTPVTPIAKAERWSEPRRLSVPYPATDGQKSTVFVSWLCSDSTDPVETLSLAVLTEALLGHDGSPLSRALVESSLGEDISPVTGLEGELRETVFSVGLRGVESENAEKVEQFIFTTLSAIEERGIPPEEISAALLSLEFSNREIRRAGGPYSLVWMRRVLRSWLHGASPWGNLLFVPPFTEVKQRIAENPRYLEGLIKKYLLANPHRSLVSVDPEVGLLERKEEALRSELDRIEKNLSLEERKNIIEKTKQLEAIQSQGDSPEALATIPHLSLADLSQEVEILDRRFFNDGIALVAHDQFTNGISYFDFAFPVDILPSEDYAWLPLLSRTIPGLGLPEMDYGSLSSLLAQTVGGFSALLHTSSLAPGASRSVALPAGILDLAGRDWLIFRVKVLDEKIEAALDLSRRIILEADFSDLRRLDDLMGEFKNDFMASIAPSGHSYALSRSSRLVSRSKAVEELWNGLSQFERVRSFGSMDRGEIARKLASIRDTLVQHGGIIVNVTADGRNLDTAVAHAVSHFRSFGLPRPRNKGIEPAQSFYPLIHTHPSEKPESQEVYGSTALQVGFAALAIPGAPFASREQAAELVLAHRLSTGILWEDIRMKGGAYGAFAYPDGLEPAFLLATYRDPNPLASLGALKEALRKSTVPPSKEELEKAIIGTYSKEVRPRTGSEKGMTDFMRLLTGITDPARKRKLDFMVNLRERDLVSAAERLYENLNSANATVLAGSAQAEQVAQTLGVTVQSLE